VNESIARIYEGKYGRPVHVLRNLPLKWGESESEGQGVRGKGLGEVGEGTGDPDSSGHGRGQGTGDREKILIYQGALNIGRGIELMIEAMRHLPEYRLVIAGFGSIEDLLQKLAAARPFAKQISFTGYLMPMELRKLTATAILGMSLEADKGASYHFALPNKLFDYIQAGVPVLVSDLPEMRAVVVEHGVGEVLPVDERTPEKLALRIRGLCEDVDKYAAYRSNCQQAAKLLVWENEVPRLRAIFEGYL
jgi:glycosyltransferase involved in cell wall biosynthesis